MRTFFSTSVSKAESSALFTGWGQFMKVTILYAAHELALTKIC